MKRGIAAIVAVGMVCISLFSIFNFIIFDKETSFITNGELHLQSSDLGEKATLTLDGEWEFYPGEMIVPDETKNQFLAYQDIMKLVDVPGSWNEYISEDQTSKGVGTYRLLVHVPSDDVYGVKTNKIHYANQLFMNGKLVDGSGTPSQNEDEYDPNLQMYIGTAPSKEGQIEIVFHVANHNYPNGGIVNSVDFGTAKAIERLRDRDRATDATLISGYLILGLFYLGTFFRRKEERYFLWFSLLCLAMGVYLSMLNERLIDLVIPNLSLSVLTNMQLSIAHFIVLFFLWFVHLLYKGQSNRITVIIFSVLVGIDASQYLFPKMIVFFPGAILPKQILAVGILMITSIYATVILIKAFVKRRDESEYILVVVTSLLCYGFLITVELLLDTQIGYLPVILFFIMMYCLSLLMGNRSQKTYEYAEQLSKDLLIQDRLKDEFLAKTSLQLGAPLQSISRVSQSLMEGTSSPLRLKQREDVLLIHNISTRLVHIVSDLLDASKIKQGELNIQPKPTKVTVVKSVLDEMDVFIATSENVILMNEISDDLPLIYVDEQRLKQIIFILLNNAIDYTNEGKITISAHLLDDKVNIVVADTGIGIPSEDIDRVFSAFFQVENHYNKGSTGLGLGLTIAKQLVDLSGGEIWVTSTVGEGTIFAFSIPIATQEQLGQQSETITDTDILKYNKKEVELLDCPIKLVGDREYTILIVNHHHEGLKEMINIVHSIQYTVIGIDNGQAALDIINHEEIDLLIVDSRLPDITANTICKAVRKMHHMIELPILILSATRQGVATDTFSQLDVNGYLHRPIDRADTIAKIESLLAMKKSSQEALHEELGFFYAQITPHFLYNTLNTIIGLSYKDPEKTREALQHLAVYFRAKLDFYNRDAIIPLQKELNLIKSYLEIEKMRYGDKLDVQFHIAEEIDVKIPTLALQPLIENAVQHGIVKQQGGGTLWIIVQKDRNGVEIIIEDNGVGMTKEKQAELLHEKSTGIGIMNSIKRLKLMKHTKVSIKSEDGAGTKITIFLPGVEKS